MNKPITPETQRTQITVATSERLTPEEDMRLLTEARKHDLTTISDVLVARPEHSLAAAAAHTILSLMPSRYPDELSGLVITRRTVGEPDTSMHRSATVFAGSDKTKHQIERMSNIAIEHANELLANVGDVRLDLLEVEA
ncbi:MAG: hypothetical protein WA843_05170 [Candidatus Saccharimonadales bacterium]